MANTDKNSEYLFSPDKAKIKKALTEIHKASNHFRIQQGKLNLQLQQSQIQTQSLKKELGDISKEIGKRWKKRWKKRGWVYSRRCPKRTSKCCWGNTFVT